MESELADVIQFFPDGKGKLLMVPGNVTLHDHVLEVQSARNELEIWKTNVGENNRFIDQASLKIRSAIKEDIKPTPLPFYPSDATTNLSIPHVLELFLVGLLTGDPERKSTSHRASSLVQSFSQDLLYAVTCGKYKPPKHFLLPYAVKTFNR